MVIESTVMKDLIERASVGLAEILVPSAGGLIKSGTGFAISADGRCATCMHVLGSISELHVQFWGTGKVAKAEIVKWDADHDLAILSTGQSLRPLPLGEFSQIDIGEDVVWGGFPLEVWVPSFHKGMVSFKGGMRLPQLKGEIEALQLDGTMNRGNSGGPIIDPRDGRVVGIVSSSMGAINEDLAAITQRQKEFGTVAIVGVDPIAVFKMIITDMDRHLQLGVG